MKIKLIFIFFVFTALLFPMSEHDIKLSGNYLWGEAEDKNLGKAKSSALQDMIFKIQVTISSEMYDNEQQVDGQFSEETRSTTQAFTRIRLEGVDYFISKRRGVHKVVAFISKTDYKKSLEVLAKEISDEIKVIEQDEKGLGIHKIVSRYYHVWLKCYQSPEPIKYTSISKIEYSNVINFLQSKVETYLDEIRVSVSKTTIDSDIQMITISLDIQNGGKPANGITARIDLPDSPPLLVVDGKTHLFLYQYPSKSVEHYKILLGMHVDENTVNPDLLKVHKTISLKKYREIEVDYSDFIHLDFSVKKLQSGKLLFTPNYKNFSVSSLEWDFGDGNVSKKEKPLHGYTQAGEFIVKLTFNNSQDISVVKMVSNEGFIKKLETPKKVKPKQEQQFVLPQIMKNLVNIETYNVLSGKLNMLKKQRKIMVGKKTDFLHPENCYVFIIHPRSKAVEAVLNNDTNGRKNILTGQEKEVKDYRGRISLYVEVYK